MKKLPVVVAAVAAFGAGSASAQQGREPDKVYWDVLQRKCNFWVDQPDVAFAACLPERVPHPHMVCYFYREAGIIAANCSEVDENGQYTTVPTVSTPTDW